MKGISEDSSSVADTRIYLRGLGAKLVQTLPKEFQVSDS